MKILQINKFFYPKSGSETYYFSLCKLLSKHGHKVVHFSMQDKKNERSPYAQFFVSHLDISDPKISLASLKQISRLIWSSEAKEKLKALLKKEKVDLAHLHNIDRHLTPAIIPVLKKYKIPIVMTLHDYKIICPNSLLFTHEEICERCLGKKFYSSWRQKCIKDSCPASLIGSVEAYYHDLRKVWQGVDLFLSPSQFMRQKMIEFGHEEEKVVYLPMFLGTEKQRNKGTQPKAGQPLAEKKQKDGYFLYFGRLSGEKGVGFLIKVFAQLPHEKLKIAGSGPQEKELIRLAKGCKNVEFLGFQNKKAMVALLQEAKAVIIPSLWYENAPYTVMEAMERGKVVIGSRIGGIPELIEDQQTGLLFRPQDTQDLMSKIEYLYHHPEKLALWGENAQKKAREVFNPEVHYQKLLQTYHSLIGEKNL